MNVKTVYLYAPIDYEIFVEQPEGFKTNKLVYRLNKSLYGLKQSGRNWNKMLHECLIRNDFIQNPADHCVYMKQNERLIIVSWVDDLIIAADIVISLSNVKKMLMSEFKILGLSTLEFRLKNVKYCNLLFYQTTLPNGTCTNQNPSWKILKDFQIQTDHLIPTRRLDQVTI